MQKSLVRLLAAVSFGALCSAPALAQATKLEVTAWKGNEAEPAGLSELIGRFQAENPDIFVELSYISRTDTDLVLPPRLQGDNPPDVMMTDMPLVKVWGEAGLLMDLGKGSDWYSNIGEGLRPALTLGDAAYIMPLEMIGMGNFVNMGLLGQVGIDKAPSTIDELKQACSALADAGINPMIFTGSFSAALFMVANGLQASDASPADLGSGEATFADDAGFNSSLDLVRELIDARCFDPAQQAGLDPWSTALSEFSSGNFAMMPQGAWNIAGFSKVDGLDFVFAPIPAREGGVALDLFGIGWSIPAKTDAPEAARKFIEFFAQPENLQIMVDAEAAYSPYADGVSGTPELAAPYDEARENGGIINYPIALLQWPKSLEQVIWDSMTGFLLDTSKSNEDVLVRWDEAVEDAF